MPLGMRALWDPGESRYAEIAREMLELKDWLVPHLNYVIYLDKPPLMYWLTALAMRLLGPTPVAARFWCATFGVLTIGVTYLWGTNWKNERLGLIAGGILATSIGFFALTQFLSLDMALTFWTTLTLFAGSSLLVERSVHRVRRLTYLLAIGIAGGVLTKGPVVLVLVLAALTAVYVGQGRRIPVVKRPWKAAIFVGALLALPWFVLVFLKHPIFPYYAARGEKPLYYFLPVLAVGFLPWAVFLPQVARTWFGHQQAALQRDPEGAVMVAWVALVVVFFTLVPSKWAGAILPVFPALALLVAHEFDETLESSGNPVEAPMPVWVGGGVATLVILLFTALLILKLPPQVLSITAPEWKLVLDQSGLLAVMLGIGVFVLVGVWGMRQTLTCVGGVMLLQVMLLTSAASLAPELDPYRSSRWIAERFQMRAAPNDALVLYQPAANRFRYGLSFYSGRRVAIFGPYGELTRGQQQDSASGETWFVPEDKAEETLLAMPAGTWAVTDPDHWQALRQKAPDTFQQLALSGSQALIRKQH